jgi:UDP-glucose 4-epimerase
MRPACRGARSIAPAARGNALEARLEVKNDLEIPLEGMRCLVLGAGGFLGQALSTTLCDRGAVVQGYGRMPDDEKARDNRVAWTNAPFSDISALARAVEDQEIVFHLLGSSIPESSNSDPAEDLSANVFSTIKLLDLCRAGRVRKVVFASSGGTVYGVPAVIPTPETAPTDPISAYGISKLAIEKYLALYHHLHGLDYHVLRIANPYGPGQSPFRKQGVVASILYRAMSGKSFEIWGTGDVTRDFIHVDDVSVAFVDALRYTGAHRVMNVGGGEGRTINQVVDDVQQVLGLQGVQVTRKSGRAADVPVSILDTSLIRSVTTWRPRVSWIDGLTETAAWIRKAHGL